MFSQEMSDVRLNNYMHFGAHLNDVIWRPLNPVIFYQTVQKNLGDNRFFDQWI